MTAWQVKYWADQLKSAGIALIGLAVLALPCALRAWGPAGQTIKKWPAPWAHYNGRPIDGWTWKWLWPWYHNPEDGDSGATGLVWGSAGLPVIFNPTGSRWQAYKWSALRNTADGLKYRYAIPGEGPMVYVTLFGKQFRYGYELQNGYNVPVLEKM